MLVEIWISQPILQKSQKEKRRAVQKASLIIENRCIVMDRILLEMNVKAASGEVSDGNKDHITGI